MASTHSSSVPVATPGTPRELADLLGEVAMRGGAVTPIGGGTKQAFGNVLSRETERVSTKGLHRVLAYEPDDMTISVEAGATIGEVWRELETRGQTIPIEVPNPDGETIGGLIATGLCGPRRYGSGSLRDALIGIQVAYPDATLGNAGGMVVKNVSGFDLMRMHLGALGTLGVVVSANFKVIPAARAEATITFERHTLEDLEHDRRAVLKGRIRPIAFEAWDHNGNWRSAIRIEGRPSTVEQMAREVADARGDATIMSTVESRAFWRDLVRTEALTNGASDLMLHVRGKPSNMAATLVATTNALDRSDVQVTGLRISAGLGSVRVSATVGEDAINSAGAAVISLRETGKSVVLLAAPAALHRTTEVFGLTEPTLELMRSLKRQFDPRSVLNPGRVIPEL